ncbi:MAG: ATP-binding protein [Butyrivibrio crossotus]|nr:ATP-binding protein [Butyrivibrio crossotus]MDY4028523.1 ATP-binding protein [Butyrivibrio crossotus]
MNSSELLLYKNPENREVFDCMLRIASEEFEGLDVKKTAGRIVSHILEVSEKMGFNGNLWQDYLAYNLANDENSYSLSCERRGRMEGSINKAALLDMAVYRELFNTDLSGTDAKYGTFLSMLTGFENNNEGEKYYNKRIRNRIIKLAEELSGAVDDNTFLNTVCDFYKDAGVGCIGLFKAFRVEHDDNDRPVITPVISVEHKYLKDLIGYDIQKKKITDNTEAFLAGSKANNVLLFGDSGTGKSSCIKAILNEYYDDGLRMIEIYKHQFKDLSAIINQVKDRNYKFIIYMDDLSFEEFEIEYKFLKAVIEGGLEKRPDNVLIYATSNRRHLVREKYSDKEERDDDLHTRDTVAEKLSLSARFGVSVYFGSPDKKLFNEIVKGLAQKNNIKVDENTLLMEANKWELSHGGLSGRTAEQFISYMVSAYAD